MFYRYPLLLHFLPVLIPLLLIELVLKGYALWKAARNNQSFWFVAILIINSLGILSAVYLLWFQRKVEERLHKKRKG